MVEELCHQVKELQKEVNRLHSIRVNKQEIERLFSETLQSQDSQESQASIVVEKQVDPEPCRIISQGSVKDEGWKQVACTKRKVPPPSQNLTSRTGTFYNRYEALELEGQTSDEAGEGPSGIEGPPKAIPPVCTSQLPLLRGVVVIRDSLLRVIEDPICRPDPTHTEVCSLPGAWIRDITRKPSSLVRPSDYYPLLVVQASSEKITKGSLKAIKSDFRALWGLVEGSRSIDSDFIESSGNKEYY